MFDFNKIYSQPINQEFLLANLSEEAIFYYYYGKSFKLGQIYPSVFRKDRNPSTGFYINKSGKLIYNDLSTGEKLNCIAFVAKLYNISYSSAIRQIASDFGLISSKQGCVINKESLKDIQEFDREYKKETIIQFVPEKWNNINLSYWRLYEITQEELIRENIYPVKELFINKVKIGNKNNDFRYALVLNHEGRDYVKVYTPFDKQNKWINNIPLSIPFGIDDLDYSEDKIIITKSKKDLIILKKFHNNVIATQNESESALSGEYLDVVNKFKTKIIIWDNDETGLNASAIFEKKGFKTVFMPKNDLGIKDCSDYVQWYGVDELEDLLREVLYL